MSTRLLRPTRISTIFQRRGISTNYLKDVWTQRTLRPTNPLLDALQQEHAKPLNLYTTQPHHVSEAASYIQSQTAVEKDAPPLDTLQAFLNPRLFLTQFVTLQSLLAQDSSEWDAQMSTLGESLSQYAPQSIYEPLQEVTPALVRRYEEATGTVVSSHHGSVSSLSSSSFDKEAYQKIVVALQSVETDLSTSGGDLSSVYNYVGLRTMQAQQWGYKHLADQAFRNGASVQLEQVDQLHHDLVEAVVPFVCKFNKIEKPKSLVDDYTGATGKTYKEDLIDVNVYNAKVDRFNMLKLEDHVTLDGALSFLFRVADDLLGVTFEMVEKQRRSSYDSEIHYYQVFDKDHKLLGSFYLDPFRAIYHDEVQPVTLPLVPRGPNTPPVVYLRLGAATRMFDSDPQGLSWDEVESLFHEFGHLFQFMRAASDHGAVLGPQNMPMDLSEILPKFMELWLTEQSTIYALMNLSNTTETFKDETLQAAFRNRAHNKSLLIAQNVFLGAVELKLFSGFDLKGSESVLDMQRRLAEEIVPHDLPDKKDLTLITDLLLENANGREVCRYRYTLGDVLAASLYESCRRRHTEDPSKLQQDFLRVLVEPGANVNLKDIQETFGIQDLSIKPLLDRYCF